MLRLKSEKIKTRKHIWSDCQFSFVKLKFERKILGRLNAWCCTWDNVCVIQMYITLVISLMTHSEKNLLKY